MGRQAPPPLPRESRANPDKRKFLVTGPHSVNGVAPGETVELELSESAIAALVEAGHITPAPKAAKPQARSEERAQEREQ